MSENVQGFNDCCPELMRKDRWVLRRLKFCFLLFSLFCFFSILQNQHTNEIFEPIGAKDENILMS